MTLPIAFLLPVDAENRWSDLLAFLIETDPAATANLLDLGMVNGPVKVRREAPAAGRDRVDLAISVSGRVRALLEVKVFSGLGRAQLSRYADAYPDVTSRVLVSPARVALSISADSLWREVSWERLLSAFASSADDHVAWIARNWLEHLDAVVPAVGPNSVWGDVPTGDHFPTAMRARMVWVSRNLLVPDSVTTDLVPSVKGVSWVARIYAPAARTGYRAIAEAEERLPVQNWPKFAGAGRAARGPGVKVCLAQENVRSSADFDWTYLARMWPAMLAARTDWVTNKPRPRSEHDRAGIASMAALGAPPHLGIGFGDRQARRFGECMFGARFQLPPTATLEEVAQMLTGCAELVQTMAAVP